MKSKPNIWCTCESTKRERRKYEFYDKIKFILARCSPWYSYTYNYYDNLKYFFNPGNVVKCPQLDYRYNFQSNKMLHACFELLREFVEEEHEFGTIDPDRWNEDIEDVKKNPEEYSPEDKDLERLLENKRIDIEIMELYNWWNLRKLRTKPWDIVTACIMHEQDKYDKQATAALELEESYKKEDQSMFKRLAEIREYIQE